MKTYSRQPETKSDNAQPKASQQASAHDVLQAYKDKIAQRQEIDEDELLQGKFEITQRKEIDEDELLQGKFEIAQPSTENLTGMPDNLKSGIESLSGYSMDDVRVHYNSSKPAQLQALAYAQGTDIHIAPGQEQHLPHEAWHVAQQKQGRVQPTTQLQGVNVNDNEGLEKEADVMGGKADVIQRLVPLQGPFKPQPNTGSYVARGGQDTRFSLGAHPRERFSFGTNTRYEVFEKYNPTRVGNRIVSIRSSHGEQVNVEGIQLDHQISWDNIANEMERKNTDGTPGFYSFWDAKMYYNDIGNLVPALGAINAAAGVHGVQVEKRLNATLEAAIGVVQQSWMNFQHIINAIDNGQGFSNISEGEIINILLNVAGNLDSLSQDIHPV